MQASFCVSRGTSVRFLKSFAWPRFKWMIPMILTKSAVKKVAATGISAKVSFFRVSLSKKRLWHRCFPVNFAKNLRTPVLQSTSGRLLLQAFSKERVVLDCNNRLPNWHT